MHTNKLFTSAAIVALLAVAGCDATVDHDNFTPDANIFRAAAWDDVRCMTSGGTDRCYAHTPDADELWFPVVSWCELKRRLDEGEYYSKSPDWNHLCDDGGHPETFDEYLCFVVVAGVEKCFGGSNGWFTEVEPECLPTTYSAAAWGPQSCDPDTYSGVHSFDSVNIAPGGAVDWGRVTDSGDAFYAVPECAVPAQYAAGDPYAC